LVAFFLPIKIQPMDELPFYKGDFVRIDGINAVVVANEEDESIPEGHIAVFFGSEMAKRESEGGEGNGRPRVWIVPIDVCEDGLEPEYIDA
jgi:hypothetical protein